MSKNFSDFSSAELMKMLQKPETQALISRLQQLDSATIEEAAKKATNGNTEGAKELLTPLLKDELVQNLAQKLRDENGGI